MSGRRVVGCIRRRTRKYRGILLVADCHYAVGRYRQGSAYSADRRRCRMSVRIIGNGTRREGDTQRWRGFIDMVVHRAVGVVVVPGRIREGPRITRVIPSVSVRGAAEIQAG